MIIIIIIICALLTTRSQHYEGRKVWLLLIGVVKNMFISQFKLGVMDSITLAHNFV